MKPEKLFNGVEFFPAGVPISSHPLSLEELDKYLGVGSPPSNVEGADESKIHREANES
jgi:hypothetical protein